MRQWGAWLALGLLFFIPMISMSYRQQPARLTPQPNLSVYPWIYLRQGESQLTEENVAEIILVGDILCGREGNSSGLNLGKVTSWLATADLAIGNLECVISPYSTQADSISSDKNHGPYLLYASPKQASVLRLAGFDILGVANNHALDLGQTGLIDTASFLKQNSIRVIGTQIADECIILPEIVEIGDVRIAILAFNAIPFIDEVEKVEAQNGLSIVTWQERICLLSAIQNVRQNSDAVIVSAHWGNEYGTRFDPTQREIARQLIEAGADLVVGHHPHVAQKVEIFESQAGFSDAVVAYSLGNFLADQQFGETENGLAIRALFDNQGLHSMQTLPIQSGPQPYLLDLEQASSLLERIIPDPMQLTFSCNAESCFETFSPMSEHELQPVSGLFWSGEIDLTGDGLPEQIQRQAASVFVYEDRKLTWQTPDNWQVVDLALGDPDQDGRLEMMMAFWRPDQSGVLRSHPFIVGFRGGTYHETWGGSGVSDPIQELELGDVDGDGSQELVVLELRSSGLQAVTVWEWHGWGFSLKWRSPEAFYQDLHMLAGTAGRNQLIQVSRNKSIYTTSK